MHANLHRKVNKLLLRFNSNSKNFPISNFPKGSGIWFNLGKTVAFNSHGEAQHFFNATKHHWPNSTHITTMNEWMCFLAAKAGYDSIQFLKEGYWPSRCYHPNEKFPEVRIIVTNGKSFSPLFKYRSWIIMGHHTHKIEKIIKINKSSKKQRIERTSINE